MRGSCGGRGLWRRLFFHKRVKVNFLIHYEIDQQTVKTALRLDEYDGDEDAAWVLLEADAGPGE